MAHRTVPSVIKLMRLAFAILGVIAPPIAVAWVYKIWFRSPRYKTPKRELAWREQSRPMLIHSPFGRIMTYHWGDADKPRVFFVHGWSGRGLQLGAFAVPLLTAGYSVTSFDAPGHGQSDGHATSIFQIAGVLRQLVLAAKQPHAIIAHSFGCMVSAYALRNYQLGIHKFVAISSPTLPQYLIKSFVETFQLNSRVTDGFIAELKKEFGEDVLERISADKNLQDWSGELLVIHDKDDDIVHWQHGEQLAQSSQQSKIMYTSGLGHRRILGNDEVITASINFIQGDS
jgi:pimeloyl-ACP methyl ester carboxylesterase